MTTLKQRLDDICNATCVGTVLSLSKDLGVLQVLLDAQQPLTSHEIADMKDLKESTSQLSDPNELLEIFSDCVRYSDTTNICVQDITMCFLDNSVQSILKFVDGLKDRLESGIDVTEFGCRKGGMISRFGQMFPESTFTASVMYPSLIEELKVTLGHIPNIKSQIDDLSSLPNPPVKQYDWVYCSYVIHEMPYPLQTFQDIKKLIKKPHGIFTMIDIATSGCLIDDKGKMKVASSYSVSTFLCIPESFQKEDSQALGPCWGKQTAINLSTKAGFRVQAVDILDYLAGHNLLEKKIKLRSNMLSSKGKLTLLKRHVLKTTHLILM